jgi:hypothetical protein
MWENSGAQLVRSTPSAPLSTPLLKGAIGMADSQVTPEWRAVPGLEGRYEVSNMGGVRSLRGGVVRELRPVTSHFGYLMVALPMAVDGTPVLPARNWRVHRLVLLAFVGPCPSGLIATHLDGTRTNNRLSNLAWRTPKDNSQDAVRHGTMPHGEICPGHRLTESQVDEILRRHAAGEYQKDLAREFGVSSITVMDIVAGTTWKHLNHPLSGGPNYRARAAAKRAKAVK